MNLVGLVSWHRCGCATFPSKVYVSYERRYASRIVFGGPRLLFLR